MRRCRDRESSVVTIAVWRGTYILAFACLSLLSQACAGGDSSTAPTRPPTNAPVPASLSLAAGDNQQATPGSAVAVDPAVIVRDNTGRGISGVSVSFVVDSGQGSVVAATAVTASDGSATAGRWTLGPSEGTNVLRASVAGLTPVVFHATARRPAATADTTLGPGGGSVVLHQAGDPLDGTTLTMPAGAYGSPVHWTISTVSGVSVTLPPNVTLEAPVLRIGNGQGMAAKLLTLRIPVRLNPSRFAAPFYYDPASGTIEAMPLVGRDSVSVTVAVRHFSTDLLLKRRMSAQRERTVRASASVALAFGDVYVIVPGIDLTLLDRPITTSFAPGTDDWEFINYGSYLAPGGHCAGQSMSALWYFYERKAIDGPLYHKFDRLDNYWVDNPLGYRFASVAQQDMDWSAAVTIIDGMESAGASNQYSNDFLHFYTLALSLLLTQQPQFVEIESTTDPAGHALIAYRTAAGVVGVADPNYPGQLRNIVYQNDRFVPYASNRNAASPGILFDKIRTVGVTAMVPLTLLQGRWIEFQAGLVGEPEFPVVRLQAMQPDSTWSDIRGSLVTSMRDIRIRMLCPTCAFANPAPGAAPGMQYVGVDDSNGNPLERANDGLGVAFQLPTGHHQVGLSMWAAATDPNAAGFEWAYHNFEWLDVVSAPFTITPDPATGTAGAPVTFVSRPLGKAPANARYVWTFNDGTAAVTVLGDSTVTHAFPNAGAFTVRADLFDNASGSLYARADARATITGTATTWRTTSFTQDTIGGAVSVRVALETSPNTFYGSDRIYFSTIGFNLQWGYIVFHAGGTVSGLGTQPASVWIMFRGDGLTALAGQYKPRMFARPPLPAGASTPAPNDVLATTGTPGSGTLSGSHSEDFTLVNGTHACVVSSISATKSGTVITGSFTRAYRLTPCSIAPTLNSEWWYKYDFTGVRLP